MINGSSQGFRDEIAPHTQADMQRHHRALAKFDYHNVRFGQPTLGELPIDAHRYRWDCACCSGGQRRERECGYPNMDAGRI